MVANSKWVSALNTMTNGKPDIKNPKLVNRETDIATVGEINMAINTGT